MISDKLIGFVIAVFANTLTGFAFVFQKQALMELKEGELYITKPKWWMGMAATLIGEIGNFAAYAWAPAVLVTPLGALSVIVNAFCAHFFLNESMSAGEKGGVLTCIFGAILIVINAPAEVMISSMEELWIYMHNAAFIAYALFAIISAFTIIITLNNGFLVDVVVPYLLVCAFFGSISVLCIKGVGIALSQTFSGDNQFGNGLTWLILVSVACTLITTIVYLNKALDRFGPSRVVPVYYVFFTTASITGSVLLYREFEELTANQLLSLLLGCFLTFSGVFILHRSKNPNNSHVKS
eukprot:GCRY01003956.1.p1 GENE.GCRY01003956.1~~GCRY01003956.1.p1  ORF type:complete len:296 (+),score=36.21 GCRY01003956.1:218-1105(+)